MYGLWLYKELKTEYGFAKVEVFRKGYTASAIEIGALVGNSLTLALENLSSITDPIGKSVCSFEIYDTNQVEYDDLFTPDATAYKVVVSTKLDGGNYTTRWSGYVTPDFFAENLSYRTPISISARDNIGYLNDVDFDLEATTITVRGLIQAAFKRIAEDYPMSLVFATQKQTAEGVLAIDATISTALLREKSWYEAIETILHDLGLQMRWVDNNTIMVFDISQLGEKFGLQRFNFIDKSGYREILPAWRELSQKQDYGLRENFFEGWVKNNALTFVKSQSVKLPIPIGQAGTGSSATMKYYAPNNWGVAGNTYTINTEDFAYLGAYGQASTPFGKRIYFTGVDKADTTIAQNYMSWRQNVYKSNDRMQITFKAFNSLLGTSYNSPDTLLAYNPAERFLGINLGLTTGDYIQLGLKVNLFLHVGTKTYIMRETWEEISGAETSSLYFILDKMGDISEGDNMPKEQEISIGIGNIPASGQLELRIYGFTLEDKKNLQEDAKLATYDWLRMVSYIDDVTYSYADSNKNTGVVSGVEIASLHNIKASEDYSFGQITLFSGGINAYAGGLYKANGDELVGFRRDANSTTYPLLELVGREIIHFNKRNYTKLSGTAKNLAQEPLMFNKLLVYKGKNYLPYACSLDVISNAMNITTMQEVEPYSTQSFVEIKSELVTGGGATVSGGNNTVLQYSAEVGNAKRISELNNASKAEQDSAYIVVDNPAWPESKKVFLGEVNGLDEEQLKQYLDANRYLTDTQASSTYATQVALQGVSNSLNTLRTEYDALNALLNDDVSGKINTWYEVVDFLDEYSGADDLATILSGMNTDIANNANNIASNATAITAVSNRVKTFEDIIGIDSNGDVYIKGTRNFYTAGGTIGMAGLGSGGSGGGGAAGIVTVRVNGIDYSSVNGIVTLPDYPSLAGYATEQWVNNKGYITGINSLMVTTALGYTPYNSADFTKINIKSTLGISDWALAASKPSYSWGEVSGKPSFATVATSGKYSDLSGLPTIPTNNNQLTNGAGYATETWVGANYLGLSGNGTSNPINGDVYLAYSKTLAYLASNDSVQGSYGMTDDFQPFWWNSNGQQRILHSNNFTDYALSKHGGVIDGQVYVVMDRPEINFYAGSGNSAAIIGYRDGYGVWLYNDKSGSYLSVDNNGTPTYNGNTLIHSGNIGNYAMRYYGSDMPIDIINYVGYGKPTTGWKTFGPAMTWGYGSYYVQLQMDTDYQQIYVRNNNGGTMLDWKTIAFTDSNVASAIKLKADEHSDHITVNGYGWNSTVLLRSYWTSALQDYVELRVPSYDDNNASLILTKGGNVLIGTTSDNGAKLQIHNTTHSQSVRINSTVNEWGFDYNNIGVYHNDNIKLGLGWNSEPKSNSNVGAYFKNYVSGDVISLFNEGGIYLKGNVLIGTSIDNGAKLQVNGKAYIESAILFSGEYGIWKGSLFTGALTNNGIVYYADKHVLYGGNVLIGTTIDNGGKLQVNGDITSSGTMAMAKLASSSDRSLKNNIAEVSAEQSMGIIRQLRPTTWDWKKDGKKSYGLIAQEVVPIVPEMVVDMGHLHLEYNQLHAFEIGAIQHIDSEVDKLKKNLAIANGRIEVLENELKQYRRA